MLLVDDHVMSIFNILVLFFVIYLARSFKCFVLLYNRYISNYSRRTGLFFQNFVDERSSFYCEMEQLASLYIRAAFSTPFARMKEYFFRDSPSLGTFQSIRKSNNP